MLVLPFGQPGEPELETAAAKPQKDGVCGYHPFQGSMFGHSGGVLVEDVLENSILVAFASSLLVKKLLATSSFLAFVGGRLIK